MVAIYDLRLGVSSRALRLVLAFAVLAGCTHDGGGETHESADLSDDAAASVIAEFSLADVDSQFALHDQRSHPAVVAAAGEALARGAVGDQLWAATYVWVNEGEDPEPLLALIDEGDVTIRVMAATGLIARGREEGFAPLIAALTDETLVVGHEPPAPAWYMATTSLMRFTGRGDLGPPLDADASRRLSAQQRWQAWLVDNQQSLTFDPEEMLWYAG